MVSAIDELRVHLKLVTAMFLGGADSRDSPPELRASSVRGALRFWWRAWRLAREPTLTADGLFEAESAVFGSTKGASPFSVRFRGGPREPGSVDVPGGPRELRYLFYGVTDREAWLPGGEMSLSLASRRLPADRPPLSKDVLVSLWLLCNLGGLGARTRRGAGAIQAAQVDPPWPEDLPPLSSTAESPVDLANKLGAALRQLLQLTSGSPAPSLTVPSLHPGALDIYVVAPRQPWTAAKALEDVGRKFMQFRHQYAVDHKNTDGPVVKNFANTGSVPATVQRAALGLPLPFFYRDTGSRVTVSGTVGDEDVERSSSPLHFRVVPLANDTYTVVLLFFKTPLLPTGGQLLLKSGRQVGRANAPDQTIIDEYLAQDGLLKVNYE